MASPSVGQCRHHACAAAPESTGRYTGTRQQHGNRITAEVSPQLTEPREIVLKVDASTSVALPSVYFRIPIYSDVLYTDMFKDVTPVFPELLSTTRDLKYHHLRTSNVQENRLSQIDD